MNDRRQDDRTRGRIDRIEKGWEETAEWLHKAVRRLVIGMALLWLGALIGGYFLADAYDEIQKSRFEAAFRACADSNQRHDATIVAFRREFNARIQRDPPETQREIDLTRASLAANLRLIDVFIPTHKDQAGRSTCREYADRITQDDAALI